MKNNIHNKIHDYIKNGKYQLALNTVNKFLIREYDHDLLNYRAVIYILMNKFSAALTDLDKLNSFDPKNTITLCNLGLAYKGLDNKPKSKEFFKKSIQTDPSYVQAYLNLAELLIDSFEFKECIELLNKLNLIHTKIERSFQILATCFRELNKFEEHHNSLLKCISINPYNYENYFHLGYSYLWLNDKNNAIDAFMKSYEYNKNNFAALYQINKIKKFSINDEIILDISKNKLQDTDSDNLSYFELLLSDIYYDMKDYENFFSKLHKANNLRDKSIRKKNKFSWDISQIQSSYHALLNQNFIFKNSSFTPIFILGMPRSGSSLLEQVLASNDNVYGAGEISLLHSFFERNFNEDKIEFNYEFLFDLKNRYQNHILSLANNQFVIDKLPLNFLWIGFIKIIFPNAIFINTIRNKTDVCMSLYRNFFAPGALDFTYEMENINYFYNLYISQMHFWVNNKIEIIDFCYEDFLNNPNKYMENLFTNVGIKYSNEYLEIDKNDRPVKTASINQIKNKIQKIQYPDWSNFKNQIELFF